MPGQGACHAVVVDGLPLVATGLVVMIVGVCLFGYFVVASTLAEPVVAVS